MRGSPGWIAIEVMTGDMDRQVIGPSEERQSDGMGDEASVSSGHIDRAEFGRLFGDVRQLLWCVAAACCGRPSDAEDVLQEAAIIGLDKIGDFVPGTSFSAWMTQIVRNVGRNQGRKLRRRATHEMDPRVIDQGTQVRAVEGELPFGESQLTDALDSLDDIARTCLVLRTVRDMSYQEISRVLEIPEGTAMSHVHRSRAALRLRLSDKGSLGGSGDE